ncbi:MAG: DUF969 family protein [Sphingomonadaceae bacterium]|nr:DUF969 family protein [Sphingomonadaceae bacterium]
MLAAALGLGVLLAGFLLRLNALAVVAVAAVAAGLGAGMAPLAIVDAIGHAWNANRAVSVSYVVLPVIGLVERAGLRQRAAGLVAGLRGLTVGRLLIAYLALRQTSAAIGLDAIAGPAQTVRPLLAPMAEAAARADDPAARAEVRALAQATDSVGRFFGEDIFIAMSSVLLILGVLKGFGIAAEPLSVSVWAIPTAVAAFAIHGFRLWRFDRRSARP